MFTNGNMWLMVIAEGWDRIFTCLTLRQYHMHG
jgi:hypothetical protein